MDTKLNKNKMECSCNGGIKLVLACAGASNTGQLTNEAAKQLDENGHARFYCLAGIGALDDVMTANTRGAEKLLVIDGCPTACARKTVENAGITGFQHLVVSELGIEKKHTFQLSDKDLKLVMAGCINKLN
jgi:uncharacterized metal-binding protein